MARRIEIVLFWTGGGGSLSGSLGDSSFMIDSATS